MEVVRTSKARTPSKEAAEFLSRLAHAQGEVQLTNDDLSVIEMSRDIPVDALLKRGASRRARRLPSLSENDGDWN